MFLRVVILALVAICCTARVIDVTNLQNVWEQGEKFEGDIMLTEEQTRNGLSRPASRWPRKEVRFFIDPVFTAAEQNSIMAGIKQFTARTTIRMLRQTLRPTSGDWVHITGENSGCWSYVGRIGGRQQLNLQRNGCLGAGVVIHEFLHALGFYHMQSATDRDNWVQILWQNIEPGRQNAFQSYPASQITTFGVPYDYQSVMHYSTHAFSRNGQPTIRTTNPPGSAIGQTSGFSARDIQKLELMYRNV